MYDLQRILAHCVSLLTLKENELFQDLYNKSKSSIYPEPEVGRGLAQVHTFQRTASGGYAKGQLIIEDGLFDIIPGSGKSKQVIFTIIYIMCM